MNTTPRISEAEWEVMRAVWPGYPVTASTIIERLAQHDPPWHPKTVRTLLGRLVQKQALRYEAQPQARAYMYAPLITEQECITAASESFLDRVFGGSLKPMLAHFVQQRKLSKKDIEELKRLLEGKER